MKPLLAVNLEDPSTLNYPVIASPKLDGIRVLIINGVAVSRNLKPIRNKYIQSILGNPVLNGLDGEILVGDFDDTELFRNTSSGVMSEEGEPDFVFYVFDKFDHPGGFTERLAVAGEISHSFGSHHVVFLEHTPIMNEEQLREFEEVSLQDGHEGVMIRRHDGVYKHGRSTLKEAILLKLKRFKTEEFEIVGFQERMHNANEATTNELGQTERSTHKENLVPMGDLGSLIVKNLNGVEFGIGSGFTLELRKEIWDNKEKYLGKFARCKFFAYGDYIVPRFPVYEGIREEADMGE